MLRCLGIERKTRHTYADSSSVRKPGPYSAACESGGAGSLKSQACCRGLWLHIDFKGNATQLPVDEAVHGIIKRLGVPARDVELLGSPQGALPAMVRVRGTALLVGVDAVRLVLAADEAYVLSAPKCGRLQLAAAATTDNAFVRDLLFRLRAPPAALLGAGWDTSDTAVDRSLPFELRALEGALATVARLLVEEAAALEAQAMPAAERLAKRADSRTLREVRSCKLALSGLAARVSGISQELERLLADAAALEALCLTDRVCNQTPDISQPAHAMPASDCMAAHDACRGAGGGRRTRRRARAYLRASQRQRDTSPAAAACRSMLESYLLQIGGAVSRASLAASEASDAETMTRIRLRSQARHFF